MSQDYEEKFKLFLLDIEIGPKTQPNDARFFLKVSFKSKPHDSNFFSPFLP